MKIKTQKIIKSIALVTCLGGLLFASNSNAANWNKHTVIKHGHHKVVVNQHCRGNRWHRVCREHVYPRHHHRAHHHWWW